MGDWQLATLPLAAAAVTLALYARGFSRLRRRRPDLARPGAAAAFTAGVVVALLAVVSPLDPLGENRLLTAHMAQHLLLGDVAPLLLVAGVCGPLCFFLLPPVLLQRLSRSGLRRALGTLLRPWVTFAVWALVVYGWHVPALYDAAIAHPALHDLEHASFLLAGLLVWTQILDPARHRRRSSGRRALFAVWILLAAMPLAEVLIVAGPLFPHYAALAHRPFGLGAHEDQARAGLLMMAEQIATLGAAAALLLWSHLEELPPTAGECGFLPSEDQSGHGWAPEGELRA
jgi:putative membrane protein